MPSPLSQSPASLGNPCATGLVHPAAPCPSHPLPSILSIASLATPSWEPLGTSSVPGRQPPSAGMCDWCPGLPVPSPASCGSILLAGPWQAQQSCTGEVFTFCHPRSIGRQTQLFLSQLSAPVPAGKREMLCWAGERGESWVGWWVPGGRMGQPQGQADAAHPPRSVENRGHSSLACWSQVLSLAETRAGHPARTHSL